MTDPAPGIRPIGAGEPTFCRRCDDPYRERLLLPTLVGLCPDCHEAVMATEVDRTPVETDLTPEREQAIRQKCRERRGT